MGAGVVVYCCGSRSSGQHKVGGSLKVGEFFSLKMLILLQNLLKATSLITNKSAAFLGNDKLINKTTFLKMVLLIFIIRIP
jgi:hypothetical protein